MGFYKDGVWQPDATEIAAREVDRLCAAGASTEEVLQAALDSSIFKDQAKFMEACGQSTGVVNLQQGWLYARLVQEEFIDELLPALEAGDELEILDGVIDTLVTTIGVGLSYFTAEQLQAAWSEVWASNMSKLDPETGMAIKREDGKVLKGPAYFKPDLAKILGPL